MFRKRSIRILGVISLSCAACGSAWAQAPATPTPTLWSFLGIPQAAKHLHETIPNRFGKHPGLEKKPPLKPLAAAENLKSEVPAIKKAAEMKQAEDMKAQKIKAVKYLASIGCGCYNKDGSITDALVGALDDCTEEVRYETVLAILEGAKGGACASCSQKSCCSKSLTKKLSDMAYERDDEGCYLEPSARIREAAVKALCTCCPNRGPQEYLAPIMEPVAPTPAVPGEEVPREGPAVEAPAPLKTTSIPSPARETTIITSKPSFIPRGSLRNASHEISAVAPIVTPEQATIQTYDSLSARIVKAEVAASVVATSGSIRRIDREQGLVEVRLDHGGELPVGHGMEAYHEFTLSGKRFVGKLEVVSCSPGLAHAKPIFGSSLAKFASGDTIRISHQH